MNQTTNQLAGEIAGPDRGRRLRAAQALATMGVNAQEAIPVLVRHVGDADQELAQWCQAALEDVGRPHTDQLRELIALAKSATADVAYWAVTLLGRAGERAEKAVSVLIDRLTDPSAPQVQQRAAWALGKLGPAASQAVAALEKMSVDEGPVAQQAARSLQLIRAA